MEIKGEQEFYDALDKLARSVKPAKIEPILNRAAQIISRASRKQVPIGLTKNLRKAIKTKKLKRFMSSPAPSISAIDRKKAPHAYLVHEGTGERIGKRGYPPYRGKHFGKMPSQPFHKKAWDENKARVLAYVSAEIAKLIKGAV